MTEQDIYEKYVHTPKSKVEQIEDLYAQRYEYEQAVGKGADEIINGAPISAHLDLIDQQIKELRQIPEDDDRFFPNFISPEQLKSAIHEATNLSQEKALPKSNTMISLTQINDEEFIKWYDKAKEINLFQGQSPTWIAFTCWSVSKHLATQAEQSRIKKIIEDFRMMKTAMKYNIKTDNEIAVWHCFADELLSAIKKDVHEKAKE